VFLGFVVRFGRGQGLIAMIDSSRRSNQHEETPHHLLIEKELSMKYTSFQEQRFRASGTSL
jgi:hypothetical protein